MKRIHLALLTGLMIFSLAACGKSDTGVIVNVGDISDASESNVIVRDNTEQTESTESTENSEMDYTVETAEAIENSVVETETQKFSLSYSTYTNEYEQSFDMIVLKTDNKETELIKTVDIEEKLESEIEQEEASNIEETAEE